ncbi:phosphoribosylamine--glycine ligase [Helicobacter sp. 23-1045]
MKILIVGSGGREYSIALSLKNDVRVGQIYFANGNGATANLGENIHAKGNKEIVDFCVNKGVNLVVIGPEQPLIEGLSDELRKAKVRVFAPSKAAARLEGSKIFMKNLLKKYHIPTAKFLASSDKDELFGFIDSAFCGKNPLDSATHFTPKIVIKADGLCAGKGVIITDSKPEAKQIVESMISGERFGEAGRRIVIEEFLDGFELSVFAICDGKNFILMPTAQDHKRLLDDDLGPNTGGMGAYSPTPQCDLVLLEKIKARIITPTLEAMRAEGAEFCGVLFCGIMVSGGEPFVLEFNVRFGDPECEVILPLLKTPLLDILEAALHRKLGDFKVEILDKSCVGVVVASENYPYSASVAQTITLQNGTNCTSNADNHISFAGVSDENGALKASGGRVLVCVGIGDSLKEAQKNAYNLTKQVNFKGAKMRKDIANKAIKA